MTRYHINPETGRPNQCKAKTPQACKFYTPENGVPPHFDSKEDARKHYEESREDDTFSSTLSKSKESYEEDSMSISDDHYRPSFKSPVFFDDEVLEKWDSDVDGVDPENCVVLEEDYGPQTPEGVHVATIGGKAVSPGLFDDKQVSGIINHNHLTEDSYKTFGFTEIGGPRLTQEIDPDPYADDLLEKESDVFNVFESEVNNLSTTRDGEDCLAAIGKYTTFNYAWINRGLYSNLSDSKLWHNPTLGRIDYPNDLSIIVNSEGKHVDSGDDGYVDKKQFEGIVRAIDEGLDANTTGIQKTVARGVSHNSAKRLSSEYGGDINNIPLGKEIRFDSFTSTSRDLASAGDFSYKNNYNYIDTGAVIFEMKTASGVSISSESQVKDEREVLIPRGSRFMVVGKHTGKLKDFGSQTMDSKQLDRKVTLLQLVEINEKGEVVCSSNIEETKRMRREYNNANSRVRWDN